MQIDFLDESEVLTEKMQQLLHEVLQYASKRENLPDRAELSLTIVNNEDIQKLNAQYRNKDQATDVLSFPMDLAMNQFAEEAEYPVLLGDIIISIDKAEEQAESYNHSLERELAFLAVHGFLHLIGYTHDEEKSEKAMFQKQEEILQVFHLER